MIPHFLIVDDEEDVLESLVPGFVSDLARQLASNPALQRASGSAGGVFPTGGRVNIKVSAAGYTSGKLAKFAHQRPIHAHLHLCCDKGGSFRHALRLLKEHFFAVVVSDLRFADDVAGARAGKLFIDDVARRNPETACLMYSAYPRPEGFAPERFVRKGSASNLAGQELVAKMIEGVADYLASPRVQLVASELKRRGLVYQSEMMGTLLRRLADYADLYFGAESALESGRRRPRPTLLIAGETGTGKTELAGLLHQISDRGKFPFVSATCSQLTDEHLLRSALFGHVKGSFSGATADRAGLVRSAGKGILLLDDLHKLTDEASVILHSFLDDGEYSHLGEDEVRRRAEAAIVCTVEDPRWDEIKQKQVMSDSFINRVEQLVLRVPPLRDRPEDIEHQAAYYCEAQCRHLHVEMELSPDAIGWLKEFAFPGGNSRKLRDFIIGLVTSYARVSDYLDLPDLEEFAIESGILRDRTLAPAAPAPSATPGSSAAAPAASNEEATGWKGRVLRLATKAIADDLKLPDDQAKTICQDLFGRQLPDVWLRLAALRKTVDENHPIDLRLFEELLRYFAIYQAGNPARAAKELGMKDNALREFVYSREQKRP